jgi:hypothetical protein
MKSGHILDFLHPEQTNVLLVDLRAQDEITILVDLMTNLTSYAPDEWGLQVDYLQQGLCASAVLRNLRSTKTPLDGRPVFPYAQDGVIFLPFIVVPSSTLDKNQKDNVEAQYKDYLVTRNRAFGIMNSWPRTSPQVPVDFIFVSSSRTVESIPLEHCYLHYWIQGSDITPFIDSKGDGHKYQSGKTCLAPWSAKVAKKNKWPEARHIVKQRDAEKMGCAMDIPELFLRPAGFNPLKLCAQYVSFAYAALAMMEDNCIRNLFADCEGFTFYNLIHKHVEDLLEVAVVNVCARVRHKLYEISTKNPQQPHETKLCKVSNHCKRIQFATFIADASTPPGGKKANGGLCFKAYGPTSLRNVHSTDKTTYLKMDDGWFFLGDLSNGQLLDLLVSRLKLAVGENQTLYIELISDMVNDLQTRTGLNLLTTMGLSLSQIQEDTMHEDCPLYVQYYSKVFRSESHDVARVVDGKYGFDIPDTNDTPLGGSCAPTCEPNAEQTQPDYIYVGDSPIAEHAERPPAENEVPECVDLTVDEDCPEIPIRSVGFGESANTTRLDDVCNLRRDMAADATQVVIQLPFSTEDAVLSMFDHLADNYPELLSHNDEQKHGDSLQPEFQHVTPAQQESSVPDAALMRGSSSSMTGSGFDTQAPLYDLPLTMCETKTRADDVQRTDSVNQRTTSPSRLEDSLYDNASIAGAPPGHNCMNVHNSLLSQIPTVFRPALHRSRDASSVSPSSSSQLSRDSESKSSDSILTHATTKALRVAQGMKSFKRLTDALRQQIAERSQKRTSRHAVAVFGDEGVIVDPMRPRTKVGFDDLEKVFHPDLAIVVYQLFVFDGQEKFAFCGCCNCRDRIPSSMSSKGYFKNDGAMSFDSSTFKLAKYECNTSGCDLPRAHDESLRCHTLVVCKDKQYVTSNQFLSQYGFKPLLDEKREVAPKADVKMSKKLICPSRFENFNAESLHPSFIVHSVLSVRRIGLTPKIEALVTFRNHWRMFDCVWIPFLQMHKQADLKVREFLSGHKLTERITLESRPSHSREKQDSQGCMRYALNYLLGGNVLSLPVCLHVMREYHYVKHCSATGKHKLPFANFLKLPDGSKGMIEFESLQKVLQSRTTIQLSRMKMSKRDFIQLLKLNKCGRYFVIGKPTKEGPSKRPVQKTGDKPCKRKRAGDSSNTRAKKRKQ